MEVSPSASITITVAFNGIWNERDMYSNYKVSLIEIGAHMSFSQLVAATTAALGLDRCYAIGGMLLYENGSAKCNAINISEDKDVQWMHNGFVNGSYGNRCVIAEITQSQTNMCNVDAVDGPVVVMVGALFHCKDDLKKALCKLALSRDFQFWTAKSNPKQFTAKCVHDDCNWVLRASVYRGGSLWVVRKFIDLHTCPVDIVRDDHMQATPIVIQEYAESLIRLNKNAQCTPGDVMKHAKMIHGVNISYYKAMKGKERALKAMNGRPEDSYAFLSKFAAKICEKNPGSYTAHDVDDDDRFRFFFMSMVASIRGWEYCLPAISVDGASLKNKFGGTLITACTFDGNSSIYPLAFAIVDSENDASWEWFFRNLKAVFGDHKDLVIVSDRHQSIENGFSRVYTAATQAICVFHLLKNIKPGKRTKAFKRTYFNCVNAYTREDYEYYIRMLEQMAPNVRSRMEEAAPHRWARAFAVKNRYMLMTTNVSESLNARLKHARELPVISLLEHIRDFMQQWFYERRNGANFQQLDISK